MTYVEAWDQLVQQVLEQVVAKTLEREVGVGVAPWQDEHGHGHGVVHGVVPLVAVVAGDVHPGLVVLDDDPEPAGGRAVGWQLPSNNSSDSAGQVQPSTQTNLVPEREYQHGR